MKRRRQKNAPPAARPSPSAASEDAVRPADEAGAGVCGKKERILLAAQAMFGRHGFAATTMKMIAEEAGVAFGLVAHHFGDKEKLFITAGFDMVGRLMAKVQADTERDYFMSAEESQVYGIIDKVLTSREPLPEKTGD